MATLVNHAHLPGYILSFGAVTLNASKAPDVAGPLEERLSPGRKSALLVYVQRQPQKTVMQWGLTWQHTIVISQ